MQDPLSRPRWSRKRTFFASAGLLLLGIVALIGVDWLLAQAEWDAQLAAMRAVGLPTNLEELNDYYRVPGDRHETTDVWVAIINRVADPDPAIAAKWETLSFHDPYAPPIPPPGAEWEKLNVAEEVLAELEQELHAARAEAGSAGQARFPGDLTTDRSEVFRYRSRAIKVQQLLQLDAHVAAHRGDDDRVLQDLLAMYALSGAFRGEPLLVSQVTRSQIHTVACNLTCELMPHCDWSDAELAMLQRSIRSADFQTELAAALNGDRAWCLTQLGRDYLAPLRLRYQLKAIDLFQQYFDAFDGPLVELIKKCDRIERRVGELSQEMLGRLRLDPTVEEMMLAINGTVKTMVQATAKQRCANAAIAAQRYRLQHGTFPTTLTEIDHELLGPAENSAAQLVDPFDGQSLRYTQNDREIIIYSIDNDRVDDGGDCYGRKSVRFPTDVGIVLSE